MITAEFVRTMAKYNEWQNRNLFSAAETLNEAARRMDRGAFFGSIERTLNHILWADRIWMSRFAAWEGPEQSSIEASVEETTGWEALAAARIDLDSRIIAWAADLTDVDVLGDVRWHSAVVNGEMVRPRPLLLTHLFNHQTHHRGQVHAMLTAAGAQPGPTDLPFMQ